MEKYNEFNIHFIVLLRQTLSEYYFHSSKHNLQFHRLLISLEM